VTDCDCDFDVGEQVSFPGGQGEITKVDHRDSGPCLLYLHTDDGLKKRPTALQIEKVDTGADLLGKGSFGSPDHFDLRLKAAELDLAHREDRFVALTGSRIDIEPYQVQAAYEILNSYDHRYLIGDEVGLGKTIEAAIVIEELVARDRADRVLIVTPAPLTEQWQAEMREKFDRDYMVYERDYVDATKQGSPNENVWLQDDRIITSIDFAKQDDMLAALRNLEQEWDIAVFDESHHLTARRRSDDTVDKTQRYRVGEAVSENSDGLIFLTGTPHKGKPDQFYFMLRLLDRYRFRHENDITPEELDDLMIRRLKEDMYETDGTPMFPEKNIETLPVDFTPAERELYEGVTEYISEYYNLASRDENNVIGFAMAIYQKRLVSSIHAIRRSLKQRMETIQAGGKDPDELEPPVPSLLPKYRQDPDLLTDAQRELVEEELGTVAFSQNEQQIQREYEVVQELHRKTKAIKTDSKADRLREFVDGVLEEDPDEKVLVFTEYTDTLEYLREQVFADMDVAQIYGDLNPSQRREQMEKFRDEANVMLATDAAREGINLQFAHIMVNYDLPWNPTRIDQRIGRLHRYGQENTVEIRNLFVNDTRESEILELLVEKIDEIESALGMDSDVLGLVLDEFDLEEQIMTAIAREDSAASVAADIDERIEQQKDAIKRIEEDFLIRDRFDLSAEDGDILEVLERSREETLSEGDVEQFVRDFFAKFGGEVRGVRPGPAREAGDVFQLSVPDVIAGGSVDEQYDQATFTREVAVNRDDVEFIAPDHPLIQSLIEFCQTSENVGGQTAIKVGAESMTTPGLLCNYRLRYLSGRGETVTERVSQIYVTLDGQVSTRDIDLVGGIPPEKSDSYEDATSVATDADELVEKAENRAWELVNELAEDARAERSREVEIKREHAERYFESRIEELEETLDDYRDRDQRDDEDMSAPINRVRSELQQVQADYEAEIQRLEEDEQVVPDEPALINTAVVIGL
jgi:superfamily II DNA or RNA helicase